VFACAVVIAGHHRGPRYSPRRMLDLDDYLTRIGLQGTPDLPSLHLAHCTSIPFENLEPHGGTPVSLAQEDLERKLVGARRGGYCFEQNLLLRSAMQALGWEVDMYLARVRAGAPPGTVRPRSHLALRARRDGESWLADVGFGLGTPFEPIPFRLGAESEQHGWRFRIVEDGSELVVQSRDAHEGWADLYGFSPQPVHLIDVETINWWVCTHPHSPFVTGLVVSSQDAGGRRLVLSDWGGLALTERTASRTEVRTLERPEVPELLASRFGLEGFELCPDGRLRLPAA
jgi:N-hydroxyarylamine O-acetyltransferase